MATEQFGNSQIKELRFSKSEIEALVHENILARMSTSYDFDYRRPIIIHEGDELIFRFVQVKITTEADPKRAGIKPLEKSK
jgi:hypothetical protein